VSLAVFTATAVGGLGSVVGAVAGAALVEGSAVFLPPSWQLFPSAFGVVLVLLAFPGGVASLIFDGRDKILELVASRHDHRPDIERAETRPGALPPAMAEGGL
jgi:hypothetical protein